MNMKNIDIFIRKESTEISILHNNYLFKNNIKQMSISKENNNILTFNLI